MCLEARVDKNQFVLFHACIHALKVKKQRRGHEKQKCGRVLHACMHALKLVDVHGNAFSDVCGDDFNKFYKKHELKGTYNKQISAQ